LVQAAHALALMRVRRDTAEPALAISRQVLLQPLQQRHEIPDGEDMIFHESLQILDGSDLRVNGVVEQLRAKRVEAVTVLFRHV